jgi:hypothetical protein
VGKCKEYLEHKIREAEYDGRERITLVIVTGGSVSRRGSEERLLNYAMSLMIIARRRSGSYFPSGKDTVP